MLRYELCFAMIEITMKVCKISRQGGIVVFCLYRTKDCRLLEFKSGLKAPNT